jgi:MoaA/NifB/PqqE/SkfB family radical SAM enzyme
VQEECETLRYDVYRYDMKIYGNLREKHFNHIWKILQYKEGTWFDISNLRNI